MIDAMPEVVVLNLAVCGNFVLGLGFSQKLVHPLSTGIELIQGLRAMAFA